MSCLFLDFNIFNWKLMRQIAIIGAGPRGLSALENLFFQLSKMGKEHEVVVSIFETTKNPGSGKIWNAQQPRTNWLNISERRLKQLPGRVSIPVGVHNIPEFPSYLNWLPKEEQYRDKKEADTYPPRSKLGKYLNERFTSIAVALEMLGYLKIIKSQVVAIDYVDKKFKLNTADNCFDFDEVLLTIGHQPTHVPEQLKKWKGHAEKNPELVFKEAYPIAGFMFSEKIKPSSIVAIRGFKLTMIDVVRALSIGKAAEFEILDKKTFRSKLVSTEKMPKKIVVFSLDGNPMAPKPLNAAIDLKYAPSPKESNKLAKIISKHAHGKKEIYDAYFLVNAISEIASRVYLDLENSLLHDLNQMEIKSLILEWFTYEDLAHALILPTFQPPAKSIKQFVNMAIDEERVSLDYCVGQVWRHCQPIFYNKFAHAHLKDTVLETIIALAERMKRYSYGPPVESMQQLLALIDAGKLDLDFVANPKITEVENGWKLKNKQAECTAQIMINSVLDASRILEVTSPIIRSLLFNQHIKPLYSAHGIKTRKDGTLELSSKASFIPIAILGRLAQGSAIGVDAILECFGPRVQDWALSAAKRV